MSVRQTNSPRSRYLRTLLGADSKRKDLDLKVIPPRFTLRGLGSVNESGRVCLLIFRTAFHWIIIRIGAASKTCVESREKKHDQ